MAQNNRRTPGSWRWSSTADGGWHLVNDLGDVILIAHKPLRANFNLAADRTLIALAPDLLEAVEDLLDEVPYAYPAGDGSCECGEFEQDGECAHSRAREVLKKVRGEA